MSRAVSKYQTSTISREFATRLDHLDAKKKIRAVVMLRAGNGAPHSTRPSRKQRATLIRNTRKTASAALPSIDRILKRHHGKRLSADVGPLGNIVVEATADGIRALAASEHVTAVLEDQSILQLAPPKN
jgi:hypothetical protein